MKSLRNWCTFALLLALPTLSASAEPLADRFEGQWTCKSRSDGKTFTWSVRRDLAGGWLTGEGIEAGRRLSLDVWAYDAGQRLQRRRQFTPAGAIIEMDVIERTNEHLRLEGTMVHRDGRIIRVRERIMFKKMSQFDAVWEVDDGSGWRAVVDEICEKPV